MLSVRKQTLKKEGRKEVLTDMSLRTVEALQPLLVSVTSDFPKPYRPQHLDIVTHITEKLHGYTIMQSTSLSAPDISIPGKFFNRTSRRYKFN